MYGCENWTIKKSECQRTDTFELWCYSRLLRVPWPARTSKGNPSSPSERRSILNIHWKHWWWSWSSSSLATCLEEPTLWKRPWSWERLKAKGERGQQRMRWLDNITDSTDVNLSKLQEMVKDRGARYIQSMRSQRVRHSWAAEQQLRGGKARKRQRTQLEIYRLLNIKYDYLNHFRSYFLHITWDKVTVNNTFLIFTSWNSTEFLF